MNKNNPIRGFTLRAAVCATFFSCAATVQAQQPAPAEPPKSDAPEVDASKGDAKKPEAPSSATGRRPGTANQAVEEIKVTGQRNANEDRRYSTASKIIITREDIEQYGDSNLGDVMRRLPGVTTGRRPGRPGAPQMRGMGGGFTQILIDGERIPPGFSVEQITPEQVERIEILRAPTAETGTRAIAGTINIILREPLRARNNDLRASVQEERNHYSPNLSWTRNDSFSPTGTYNFTVSLNHNDQLTDTGSRTTYLNTVTDNLDLDQRGFTRANDKRDSLFGSSRIQWRLGQGEQFTIQPFLVRSRSHNRSESTLDQSIGSAPAPYATQASAFDGRFGVTRLMSMINRRIDQDTRWELRGSVGQLSSKSDLTLNQFAGTGVSTLTQTTSVDTTDRSWNAAGKLSRNVADGKHVIVGGWEFEGVKREDNSVTRLNGVSQLADFGDVVNVSTRRRAIYLQDEWDPSPQWSSYFGARWEEIETLSDAASNPVRNNSRVLNPLAQGVWRFDAPKRDQIRIALTQSYRAPTTQNLVARPGLNTLYPVPGPNPATSPDRAGNPNLKPEIANGVDLAYENFLKSGGIVSVNLFTRRIKDLIRNVTTLENVSWATSPRYVSRPQNIGDAVTSGIEFDAKFQLPEIIDGAPAINIRANANVFRSNVTGVIGPNNRIDSQPGATGNLGADYRFRGSPISIGGNVGFTPAYKLQQTNTQVQSIGVKRVIDAYAVYTFDSSTKLRVAVSNAAARDSLNTTSIFVGNQLQSVFTDGKTFPSVTMRLEVRL